MEILGDAFCFQDFRYKEKVVCGIPIGDVTWTFVSALVNW